MPAEIIIMMKPVLREDGSDHLEASFGHIKNFKLFIY